MNGKINFYRDWKSYTTGFGNMNGEHWLGNDMDCKWYDGHTQHVQLFFSNPFSCLFIYRK